MKRIRINPGIVSLEVHGCHLLVSDKEARKKCAFVRQISETGAFVWNLLEEGKDIEEILSLFNEEYDIPNSANFEKDIADYLNLLEEQNYIIEEKTEQ